MINKSRDECLDAIYTIMRLEPDSQKRLEQILILIAGILAEINDKIVEKE